MEDDFKLAVRSLGRESVDDGQKQGRDGGEDSDNRLRSHRNSRGSDEGSGDDLGAKNDGAVASSDVEQGRVGSSTSKPPPSPPEHPLQKAINSLDMALGELNQLVHLIELARTGEYVSLDRVTPTEDGARDAPDHLVSVGTSRKPPKRLISTLVPRPALGTRMTRDTLGICGESSPVILVNRYH